MNHLASAFVRFGQSLYPLLTSFALAAGCATEADVNADGERPAAMVPGEPTPDAPPPPLAAGALDPAFGTGGIHPLAVGPAYASSIATQARPRRGRVRRAQARARRIVE